MDTWILLGYLLLAVYGYVILASSGIRIPDTCLLKYADTGYCMRILAVRICHKSDDRIAYTYRNVNAYTF